LDIMPAGSRAALVLVVAGHPDKRSRWAEMVEQAGHRVLVAVDGAHALAAAARHLPDATIADVLLPELDGVQLASSFAANRDLDDIPIILVQDVLTNVESFDQTHPLVGSADEALQHLHRLLAARTAATDSRRMLRRALADIRAHAQDTSDSRATLSDLARQIASGTDESMISVLVADDNARYVEANAAICALTGYSREQLLEMSIWDLSADDMLERGQRAWKRFLRDGRYEGPYRIRRSTGENVTIHCSSAANVVPGLHVSTMASAKLLHVLRT
jgi:PAS domain S-box-containing protein